MSLQTKLLQKIVVKEEMDVQALYHVLPLDYITISKLQTATRESGIPPWNDKHNGVDGR
ncbi:hypothetical protein MKW94_022090 [Papaver nudicaule]|uniref:Uncharacterized protein n=1 Tax=Papaver nudicaule TaxID=74823 RepID=A0AA41UYW1_PAPNU|nr:hypothetical protein [Papaver nudicaule]